jgi:hypothetical protein
MADERYSADESRKLAVLIARIWADSQLEGDYARDPEAVLRAAGISLGGRAPPPIPEKPSELDAQSVVAAASGSSASSLSTATCPCTGCTASCACCALQQDFREHIEAFNKLAQEPGAREQARKMMASWNVKINIGA